MNCMRMETGAYGVGVDNSSWVGILQVLDKCRFSRLGLAEDEHIVLLQELSGVRRFGECNF